MTFYRPSPEARAAQRAAEKAANLAALLVPSRSLHCAVMGGGTRAAVPKNQVQVRQDDGTQARYPVEYWKVWLKRVMRVQGSSEDLEDDAYSRFVWDCEVYAVTVLGVRLSEQGS